MSVSEIDWAARKGVPAVSRLSWIEALLISGFTGGMFALGMALYIAWWVRNRRKTGAAFYVYSTVMVLALIGFLPFKFLQQSGAWEYVDTVASLVWILNAFVLRQELRRFYKSPSGGELEMSPFFTAIFSVFYLNYCLWVVRDSA